MKTIFDVLYTGERGQSIRRKVDGKLSSYWLQEIASHMELWDGYWHQPICIAADKVFTKILKTEEAEAYINLHQFRLFEYLSPFLPFRKDFYLHDLPVADPESLINPTYCWWECTREGFEARLVALGFAINFALEHGD